MAKLAIIDLDGVIADNTARFAKAEEAKAEFSAHTYATADLDGSRRLHQAAMDVYWRTAFNPALVSLDTLIEGAPRAIERIELAGYDVLILTSRPESMRQATLDWFWSFSPDTVILSNEWHDQLIMKPSAFQFTKTVIWKAGMVQTLAGTYGAGTVLFVDDEQANHDELAKYADTFGTLLTAKSLDEAVGMLYPGERKGEGK